MWTDELRVYRGRQNLTVEELAELSERFVREMGLPNRRSKAPEAIQVRTIRFYASEKLMDPPLDTRALTGTYNLYGYRHLLQVLAVRRLQARDFSIRQIQTLTRSLTDEELERLCQGEPMSDRLGKLVVQLAEEDQTHMFSDQIAQGPPPAAARLASLAAPEQRHKKSAAPPPQQPASWSRIAIHEGLELHVRSDLQVGSKQEEARVLGALLEAARGVLRRPERQS